MMSIIAVTKMPECVAIQCLTTTCPCKRDAQILQQNAKIYDIMATIRLGGILNDKTPLLSVGLCHVISPSSLRNGWLHGWVSEWRPTPFVSHGV